MPKYSLITTVVITGLLVTGCSGDSEPVNVIPTDVATSTQEVQDEAEESPSLVLDGQGSGQDVGTENFTLTLPEGFEDITDSIQIDERSPVQKVYAEGSSSDLEAPVNNVYVSSAPLSQRLMGIGTDEDTTIDKLLLAVNADAVQGYPNGENFSIGSVENTSGDIIGYYSTFDVSSDHLTFMEVIDDDMVYRLATTETDGNAAPEYLTSLVLS